MRTTNDGRRRGANKRRGNRKCQTIYWTYLAKLCFLMKLPQFFLLGNSVGIMGFHTTGSSVKNQISSEMARELIAKIPILYHLWFLVYLRVLPHLQSSPTSPTSSSQDSVFGRAQSMREERNNARARPRTV